MKNICKKCNKEFQNLYEGICHQCWNKINNDFDKKKKESKTYLCPFCNSLLFKGNVSSLAMTCPRCNMFVKIPKTDQISDA
jgi:phage FluMu protein Com